MSSSPDFDARIDILDVLINALREHEEVLSNIVERFESISDKILTSPEANSAQIEGENGQFKLKIEQSKEGVIFVSGKKIVLIPEEELPKVLRSKLATLVEYELDTPEERGALERLFSMLENRKKKTEK